MSFKKRGLWLIIPGLAGFILFYIAPFIYSFYYALIDNPFNKQFVGLENFITILGNKYYRLALQNTFEFTLIGVPLLIAISFILAVLMVKITSRLRFCRTAFVIPILLPSAAVVLIWQVLFGENSAISSQLTSMIEGLKEQGLQKFPIFLFYIWKNAGYNMILFMAGMASIPKDIYEAADMDGASGFKKHRKITLPLLIPTTFFVFIMSTVSSFKIFKEVYLLYGSYPKETVYLIQHYMNNHFAKLNYQNLTAGAIIFAVLVYIFVAITYRLENRLSKGVW